MIGWEKLGIVTQCYIIALYDKMFFFPIEMNQTQSTIRMRVNS